MKPVIAFLFLFSALSFAQKPNRPVQLCAEFDRTWTNYSIDNESRYGEINAEVSFQCSKGNILTLTDYTILNNLQNATTVFDSLKGKHLSLQEKSEFISMDTPSFKEKISVEAIEFGQVLKISSILENAQGQELPYGSKTLLLKKVNLVGRGYLQVEIYQDGSYAQTLLRGEARYSSCAECREID